MFLVTVLTVIVLFSLLPLSEKADHWILVISVAVGIPKSEVNDGIILKLPESPN